MTAPAYETLEAERDKLWVTDAELIRRMGVPEKIARESIRELDRKLTGFPRKQKLWGDRRYWPAVIAYFDRQYGVRFAEQTKGASNDQVGTPTHRKYARPALASAQRPPMGSDMARARRPSEARVHAEE